MKAKILFFLLSFIIVTFTHVKAEQLDQIEINGNERISSETIIMFSDVNKNMPIDQISLNLILKNLYDTNFFQNVDVKLIDKKLVINVIENPLIEKINYNGFKAKKIREAALDNLILKPRSSYNEYFLSQDIDRIVSNLRDLGYFFAEINTSIIKLSENKININFDINIGEKARIKKITFLGNKIFKNNKLRSLILSEEYKFWKFISGKKFLNENLIDLDKRLLKNFYLNKGFYNVEINSSFAKMIDKNDFELIFNIEARDKIYFNEISLNLPNDFKQENYSKFKNLFVSLKGEPYSINSVEKILREIEVITVNDEYMAVQTNVEETITDNKLDLVFKIEETEKFFVKKINVFGNNITEESVIRNQLEIDEGDPYNEILQKKTLNNLRSLNFFRTVSDEIIDNEDKTKTINITVNEKATGEIFAGAGAGTDGATFSFGIKENNYLGRGLRVKADGTLTADSFKGQFLVSNPNFKNSNKSVFLNIQALEIDRLSSFGYKTNRTGFDIGTSFEYFHDINLGLATRTFYEKIETDSTASARQKKQAGNYFDTFLKLDFDYDKRNQRFKTSDGFRSTYSIDLPLISETNTLNNKYSYKYFTELYDDNISTLSIFFHSANSLTNEDIKLSERLDIPSSKLRGFERGKVGPKDGNDFIGGNFATALNLATTLPQILPNLQEVDVSLFFDAANVWGVDYDSSIDDGSKLRSSIGVGIDWFTLIGPMNFSFTETLTKSDTDITESFRFNIGTSF